jgi:hypothetical protein
MRGLKRRVIRIKAEDSPNVRLALAEIAAGQEPSGRMLIPGVKQWSEYAVNRRDWDPHQQCVSLDADWYEGADVRMYPAEWLNHAERRASQLVGTRRSAVAIGVDTGEGSAETALAVVDELGLVEMEARKTPDTSEIPGWTLAFARRHGVPPEKIYFDRGGGGYEHACVLRRQGYAVQTVAFGSPLAAPVKPRGVVHPVSKRRELVEEKYTYKNRRAEMYHLLRLKMDPRAGNGFGLPAENVELRRQLAPVPLWYDEEGRIYLPPKHAKPGDDEDKVTMEKLLGCSPDRSDALVLAVYGMVTKSHVYKVKSMV